MRRGTTSMTSMTELVADARIVARCVASLRRGVVIAAFAVLTVALAMSLPACGLLRSGDAGDPGDDTAASFREIAARHDARTVRQWKDACATCHGLRGDGRGKSGRALETTPPDFTLGMFQHAGTGDEMATDLYDVITEGVDGTDMPPWKDLLSDADRRALAALVADLAGE